MCYYFKVKSMFGKTFSTHAIFLIVEMWFHYVLSYSSISKVSCSQKFFYFQISALFFLIAEKFLSTALEFQRKLNVVVISSMEKNALKN